MEEHIITTVDGARMAMDLPYKCYTILDAQQALHDECGEGEYLPDNACDIEPRYID